MTAPQDGSHVVSLLDTFAGHGDRVAFDEGARTLTYAQLPAMVYRLARALSAGGLRRHDGIVALAANRPEMLMVQLAAQLIGCYYAGVPGVLSVDDQRALIADSGARALLYDPAQHAERVAELVGHQPVDILLSLGSGDAGVDLLAAAAGHSADPVPPRGDPADIAELVYTSGSTGRPKAASFTFRQCAALVDFWRRQLAGDSPEAAVYRAAGCRVLWSMPFLWLSGPTVLPALTGGAAFVVRNTPAARDVLRAAEQEAVTVLTMPPSRMYRLLDEPYLEHADLSRLELLVYHSSAATPARLREAGERLGPVLLQSYGQTETKMISALDPSEHARPDGELLRSAGRPRPGVEVQVRDDAGTVLGPGEVGEVWVRSPMIMEGYWRAPELTAATKIDGWIRTRDVGRWDADGYLYLVDRLRDVVIVDGITCYTREIEDVLATHPAVRRAAVVGRPDDQTGEAVHAFVVLAAGARVDEQELRDLVGARKAAPHVPRTITVVDDIPQTAVGKPDKNALRAELARRAEPTQPSPRTPLPR
ncbi:AMP-binding protein [Actinoplanes teichomyceticus]|uniref:Fatty-acyl-CoA synthase n=1 Tax=Actinoplanes teichomyceticus TaxID=1867 RepID=A0A561VIA8_ACTTI|nr:AMP-binding protein [Actinoplanes teichomyceticus]TWG11360.1 fatty-acyl-CoA synthase [Actinoplanes teichomyceticus]GIF15825.1 putative fatty-acid-CoA ligase FadD [Actinoplanes teichomyceticus]